MKTYEHALFTLDPDPYDAAFGDLRNGTLEPGDRVKIWDKHKGGYVCGTLEWWCGLPSILED